MKAVAISKPPSRKPSTWKVSTLIEYLKNYELDTDSLFQVSRHAAALLLLCSGRRIHDLTLLDTSADCFETSVDNIILWPKFGSKTDSATYRQAGWQLTSSGPEKLDPVVWVKHLIELSKVRRSARPNLTSLFITTRGLVNVASRTVIAGWLKTLLREANIYDSPGSFRAAVNTDLWTNSNTNLDEVLKRGNWRSKDTFLQHYFKEVRNRETNRINSVSDTFTPI